MWTAWGRKVDGNGLLRLDYFVASVVPAECVFKVLRESNPERHTRTTCHPCPTALGLHWAGNY